VPVPTLCGAEDGRGETTRAALRCSSVFHSEQCGHCPCHFGVWPPQLSQTNTDGAGLDIDEVW